MIDLIATDTMFPEYRFGMNTDEYLKENNNYLFLLREDLNYALHNLGIANFNSRQLEALSDRITKPVYAKLEDTEGNVASLTLDYTKISALIAGADGDISSLDITEGGIYGTVYDEDEGLISKFSQISQRADGIETAVGEIQDDYVSLSQSKQTQDGFEFVISKAGATEQAQRVVTTRIDNNGLNVYGGAISIYSAGTGSSNRVLYADDNGNLYIKGQIEATALSLGSGVTLDAAKLSGIMNPTVVSALSINGNQIQSNTITATQIAANTITSNEIQAYSIEGYNLKANTVTAYNIDATNLHVNAANVDGTLTAGHIKLGGNMAVYDSLADYASIGGYIGYTSSNLDSSVSGIAISSTYSSGGQCVVTDNGARISYGNSYSPYAQVYCSYSNDYYAGFAALGAVNANYTVRFTGSTSGMYFAPTVSCSASLGAPDAWTYGLQPFDDGYFYNEPGPVSDRAMKTDIDYDISAYDTVFDDLKPVSFKLINGRSGRTHLGFIAQDVEQAVLDAGMTLTDFAAVVIAEGDDPDEGRVKRYFLRKGEMMAMLVRQIQLLKARVAVLEGA